MLAQIAIGVLGVVIWLEFAATVVWPTIAAGRYPTSTYWVAPRLVWAGRAAELYDAEAFGRAAIELGANFDLGLIPAAPPHILALLPFGLLPQQQAFATWTALSLIALLTALTVLLKALRVPSPTALAVLAVLPLFAPVRHNFAFGQAFTFLLLALTVAALPARTARRDAIRAGLALAAAFIVKFWYGAAATAATLVAGRPRAAAVAVALIIASSLAVLTLIGPDGWRVWLETSLTWRQRPETSVTAYQTLHSLYSHLFRYDATWNPSPVAHAPVLAEVMWWVSVGLIGLVSLRILRGIGRAWRESGRFDAAILPIALTVPAAILVSPIAEDYHYVQTLLPLVAGGWMLWRAGGPRAAIVLLVAALALIGLPWPFNEQPVAGWWALLYYPRVYGALALWLSLVLLARSISTGRDR